MMHARGFAAAAALLVCLPGASWAQEADEVEPAAGVGDFDARLDELEREVARLREEAADEEDEDELEGWQFQLRGGWVHLQEEETGLAGDDSDEDGWMGGIALILPLWVDPDSFEDNPWEGDGEEGDDEELPFGLFGRISLEYRQITDDWENLGAGLEQTLNYINVIAGPELRFPMFDVLVPFIYGGANLMIASPGLAESQLEVGVTAGAGLEVRVHRRISVGLDYQWTWFGVADNEDADYGQLGAFVGFNF